MYWILDLTHPICLYLCNSPNESMRKVIACIGSWISRILLRPNTQSGCTRRRFSVVPGIMLLLSRELLRKLDPRREALRERCLASARLPSILCLRSVRRWMLLTLSIILGMALIAWKRKKYTNIKDFSYLYVFTVIAHGKWIRLVHNIL